VTRPRTLGLISVLPLYLAVATAIGFVDYRVRPFPEHGFVNYVPTVLDGTAEPPGRYRVLAPWAYSAVARLSGLSGSDAWIVFRWLCLVAALLAGHLYLRTWFALGPAVAGNVLVVALLPLTFTGGWAHPDHLTELALFTLACAAIARGWPAAFLVILALNALNRETSVFLLPLFLMAAPADRRRLGWAAAAAGVWLAVWLGLRWSLGWAGYNPWHVAANLAFLGSWELARDLYYRSFPWFFVIMLAPCLLLVARTWERQPRFHRVASGIVAPAFLVVGFLFSSVIEARIFTPVLPLLVPGVLVAVFPDEKTL
jgi:hypothetical protein